MSDAKAKAEARRAKILARAASSSSKVTAVMPSSSTTEEAVDAAVMAQDNDSLYLSIAETKGKDRPLAARRSFISGAAAAAGGTGTGTGGGTGAGTTSPVKEEHTAEDPSSSSSATAASEDTATVATPTKPASKDEDAAGSPVVVKDNKDEETTTATATTEKKKKVEEEEVVMSSSGKNKITYVKKSLEEIEREVAERTAAFDKKTLGGRVKEDVVDKKTAAEDDKNEKRKDDAKDSSEKKASDDKKKKKKENDNEDEAENKKKNTLKKTAELKLKQASQPVEPSSVLRLVRLIMIVLLASYTGYRTVERSRSDALKIATASTSNVLKSNNVEFDEFGTPVHTSTIPTSSASSSTTETETDSTNRTWAQYFQQRLTRQMECSVSAVSLVWYMARLLSPVVHAQYKQKPKQTKPLEMIMSFFTEGINAFLEGIYGTMGEISLHLFVLVCSVTLFTMYYSNSVPGIENAGHGTSPAIIPNAEL